MIIIEWIFGLLTTVIFYNSINRIMKSTSKSISDYVIVTIYILNCLPVLLDITLGVPNYPSYYYDFTIAQAKNEVRLVYDLYIFVIIVSLAYYAKRANSNNSCNEENNPLGRKSEIFSKGFVATLLLLLPMLHVLLSPYLLGYLTEYGQASQRGAPVDFGNQNAIFCLISIVIFCQMFFSREGKRSDYLILLLYIFVIVWLNGKRNIVLILAMFFTYYYNNSIWRDKHKINLKLSGIIFLFLLLIYSTNYLIETKGSIGDSWDEVYTASRIDFGRDDVTKFVINRETFEQNPIQDYRLQGLLANVLMFVPRVIWEDKPYPHYRYLTAELVNLSPQTIHFGMTPSIIEQVISDFGILGYPICVLFLIWLCKYTDKQKNVSRKMLLLMLILGSLSMSMDYVAIYVLIYFIFAIFDLINRNRIELRS